MRFSVLFVPVVASLALATVGLAPVAAQSVSQVGGPAEVPPASYTANQYVDSRGCVFIRAGFGGATSWVPRVSRSREVLCGYTPSLSAGQLAAAQPAAPSGPPPVRLDPTPAAPAAPARTVASAPAQTRPAAPAAPTAPRTATRVATAAPAPTRAPVMITAPAQATATAAPTPAAAAPTRVVRSIGGVPATASACANLSPQAQAYLRGEGVRCGPQAVHPGDLARTNVSRTGTAVQVSDVVAPVQPTSPPPGYRAAWDDGRLNPNRGPQTAYGNAQMSMIWTDEVPRRLVAWVITTDANGEVVYQTGVLRRGSGGSPESLVVTSSTRAPAVTRSRAVTTPRAVRETPETITVNGAHRFMQAGRYADRAAATVARDRLAAGGLAASIGASQRDGGTTYVVLAGPYADPQSLGRALATARGAGFAGAITRR